MGGGARRLTGAGLALLAVIGMVSGCGTAQRPIRIGVLTNCGTLVGPFSESQRAAVELALVARGARLASKDPSRGVTGASVASHDIELVFGCSDGSPSSALGAARRLVEKLGAVVLVGGFTPPEGLALRFYAHRRGEVTFLAVDNNQLTTLQNPAANLFRFTTDGAQWMAGLGAYAYHKLGWRKVTLVGDDNPFGYAQAAGFVSEFCSLGGQIVSRIWVPPAATSLRPWASQVPRAVDGVVLAAPLTAPLFLRAYRPHRPLERHVLVGGGGLDDDAIAQSLGGGAAGIVSAGPLPPDLATAAWKAYVRLARRTFPRLALVTHVFSLPYYVSMEAVIRALVDVRGDLSNHQRRFRETLAKIQFEAPNGTIRLDANRQAITPNYVTQLRGRAPGALSQTTIRMISDVDQSLGGHFLVSGPAPGPAHMQCTSGHPPEWAR